MPRFFVITLIKCLKGHKSPGSLSEGVLQMYLSLSLSLYLSLSLSLYLSLSLFFFGQVKSPHYARVILILVKFINSQWAYLQVVSFCSLVSEQFLFLL